VVLIVLVIVIALLAPAFRTRRSERVASIEHYASAPARRSPAAGRASSNVAVQAVHLGDRVMEGRESTSRTMALIERADLPWRAGEWFVLRVVAIIVGAAALSLLMSEHRLIGFLLGAVIGFALPAMALRFLAARRARRFETILPDVLILVATSLSSGFSLPQALDAIARDAAEPAAKEFSRALSEVRIGADVADALEGMASRMDSENMRWTTMAIRIQRHVGGNLAETLHTTAKTLRERAALKGQVRALSAEGRLSAYILIGLPIALFGYMLLVNYAYVSKLWTDVRGIFMLFVGLILLIIGIFWMRKTVEIEV
ncbi:MAG TPA: type II secretion system F family protein, partial [Phycicoccus sp.]|nr:type II secretion system F family protein [Phycicoccus sp.]